MRTRPCRLQSSAVSPVILFALGLALRPAQAAAAPGAFEDDIAALLAGVTSLDRTGAPGPLCVFGEAAFPVLAGASKNAREPLVAALRHGRGRAVAIGHGGYLDPRVPGAGPLLANAVVWAAGESNSPAGRSRVRVAVHRNTRLADYLEALGIEVTALELSHFDPGGRDGTGDTDVVVFNAERIPSADVVAGLRRFIERGGGVVTAGLGWGWSQLNPGKDLATEFRGNQLLAPLGIAWAQGTLDPTDGGSYAVTPLPPPGAHAAHALRQVAAAGGDDLGKTSAAQISAVVTRASRSLPPDDTVFLPQLRAFLEGGSGGEADPVATPKNPIGPRRLRDRLLLTLQLEQLKTTPPLKVRAHPAAAVFPGAVPDDAPRLRRKLTFDTAVPGWRSTGFYAAPGEAVGIEVTEAAAGAGLEVRIGAHSDRNWHHDKWKRSPEISNLTPVTERRTVAVNAFGGLVYLVVPEDCRLGEIEVAIHRAVEAPLYVHGVTDLRAWRETIRHRPAPWAEVGSDRVIVTVPSTSVRGLDDPAALMDTWGRVFELCQELAGQRPHPRRPERIVVDEQISAGYMHAGYPIMTWMDQQTNVVDRDHLRAGNWGLFHEVGHNHQNRDWTFGGTGEVTVNLFTLYLFEHLCGTGPDAHRRTGPAARRKHMARHLPAPDFGRWKGDPFLALMMYVQLQRAFGWEAYRDLFAGYLALPAGQRPRGDEEKRDQWLTRFSRRAGRDLGPFFQAWGVPTSEAARAAVAHLPPWMPEEMRPFLPAGQ